MPIQHQAIIWTNADLIHWHIYAELGGDWLSKGINNGIHTLWCSSLMWHNGVFSIITRISVPSIMQIGKFDWYQYYPSLLHFPIQLRIYPESKVRGANVGPTWVLSAPGGPHVGPMNFAISVPILHYEWMKTPYSKICEVISCNPCAPVTPHDISDQHCFR